MKENMMELQLNEMEMVNGGDVWDHVTGAEVGFGMGALAGMGVGAAVGGAVAGVPGALTGMQVGIAVGAVGGAVYGGIVGCTSIAETADGLMTKIRRLF